VNTYVRPVIDTPISRDDDGHIVEYGNRWEGSPPESSYSVDTHPERFAPLHDVADALITHLSRNYDVRLIDGAEAEADLLRPVSGVVRAVRVQPSTPTCAAITFIFTAYPGILLHAGLLHDFPHPICGCDACDSTWVAEADELERDVRAIVTGHFRENIERTSRRWVTYAFTYPNGTSSGQSRASDLPAERVQAAAPLLREHPGGWGAWPVRPRR